MFSQGFTKTANFDHSNQGHEFKLSQDAPNAGAGGVAPSGIPTYQPVEDQNDKPLKKGRRTLRESAQIIQKISAADIAPGVANQLKYTFENGVDTPEQQYDRAQETKNRRKAYVRAGLK